MSRLRERLLLPSTSRQRWPIRNVGTQTICTSPRSGILRSPRRWHAALSGPAKVDLKFFWAECVRKRTVHSDCPPCGISHGRDASWRRLRFAFEQGTISFLLDICFRELESLTSSFGKNDSTKPSFYRTKRHQLHGELHRKLGAVRYVFVLVCDRISFRSHLVRVLVYDRPILMNCCQHLKNSWSQFGLNMVNICQNSHVKKIGEFHFITFISRNDEKI